MVHTDTTLGGDAVPDMRFDRMVSEALMGLLVDGPVCEVVMLARQQSAGRHLYDLQLRRDPKGRTPRSWATLYYGLTAILNIEERNDLFRLTAHASYRSVASFDDAWTVWQDRAALEASWPAVSVYLDTVPGHVAARYVSKEGPVHAALSSGASDAYRVINREAGPSFINAPTRQRRLSAWVEPFNQALASQSDTGAWWPRQVRVGHSLDFLAVDIGGRLAAIEAKADSASASELSKVAVQAGVYAAMYADLLREDPLAVDAIGHMLAQRTRLGLSRKGVLHLRDARRVVPVVAIGPGRPSETVHARMWTVAQTIATAHGPNVDPVEVWYVDAEGRISEVERAEDFGTGSIT